MNNGGIVKVCRERVARPGVRSLCVIGDPGCDGLEAFSMRVYAAALTAAATADMTLVAGDLVPSGEAGYYRTIGKITSRFAGNEVFVLRGNHDTGDYANACGEAEYAVDCDGFTLVVMDNAGRRFTERSLELLARVLADPEVRQVVAAFHIPLPNRFIGNAVSAEELERLRRTYAPWRDKIAYFVCGHVHSRFEDLVDGVPMICTGGGGATIEDVSPQIRSTDVEHHVVFLEPDGNGGIGRRIVDLAGAPQDGNPVLAGEIRKTVADELMAHLRYLTLAERAEKRGDHPNAAFFRALAESEFRHARNFYALADEFGDTAGFVPVEEFEAGSRYPMLAGYAAKSGDVLGEMAYAAAGTAESVHAAVLRTGVGDTRWEVCPSCGYMRKKGTGGRCPVCGAPAMKMIQFE